MPLRRSETDPDKVAKMSGAQRCAAPAVLLLLLLPAGSR